MAQRETAILLVEDNQILRTALRLHLSHRFPVRVIEASSASEARILARQHRPVLILLDLSLPDEAGLAAIPLLRSAQPRARVVAMASGLDRPYHDLAARRGAWAFLPKEDLGQELDAIVWRALPSRYRGLPYLASMARLIDWQAVSRTGYPELLSRPLLGAWLRLTEAVHWLDLNGPWAGKPRTRWLYLANVIELALAAAVKQHAIGAW